MEQLKSERQLSKEERTRLTIEIQQRESEVDAIRAEMGQKKDERDRLQRQVDEQRGMRFHSSCIQVHPQQFHEFQRASKRSSLPRRSAPA